jgi:hypothetical protein
MNSNFISYDLEFSELSVHFELDIEYSIEYTRGYSNPNYPDAIFARGKTSLKSKGAESLLFDHLDNGNLIESLKTLENKLARPPEIQELEKIIICGELGKWKHAYWDRLRNDVSSSDDEEMFNSFKPALGNTGTAGEWNVYFYAGKPIFEASVFASQNLYSEPFYVWSSFDQLIFSQKVKEIREDIQNFIGRKIK